MKEEILKLLISLPTEEIEDLANDLMDVAQERRISCKNEIKVILVDPFRKMITPHIISGKENTHSQIKALIGDGHISHTTSRIISSTTEESVILLSDLGRIDHKPHASMIGSLNMPICGKVLVCGPLDHTGTPTSTKLGLLELCASVSFCNG